MSRSTVSNWLQGFTLIEVLIVIALISIIAAIAVPSMLASYHSAQVKSAYGTLATLRTAEGLYWAKHETYGNFTELADSYGIIDSRFSGGGTGPVWIGKVSYTFTVPPNVETFEITAEIPGGTKIILRQDGRIIEE